MPLVTVVDCVLGWGEVDQAGEFVLLGVEIEPVKRWESAEVVVGSEVRVRKAVRSVLGANTPQGEFVFFVVSGTESWQRRKFGATDAQSRLGTFNRQVSRIAEVEGGRLRN